MAERVLTYSSSKSFLTCQRKYNYRYVEQIERLGPKSGALWYGEIWHNAMELWYKMFQMPFDERVQLVKEAIADWCHESSDLYIKMISAFMGYIKAFPTEDFTPIWLEEEFKLPLIDPATGEQVVHCGDEWFLSGKVDGLVDVSGRDYLLEHKTKSHQIRLGDYTRDLDWDRQIHLYMWAIGKAQDREIHGCLYNIATKVIRKRKNKTKLDSMTESDAAYLKRYIEAYEALQDDRLGSYFHREWLVYDQDCAEQELIEMAEIARRISSIDSGAKGGLWLKNKGACKNYGRRCQYMRLCKNPVDEGHIRETEYVSREAHSELSAAVKAPLF